MSEVKVNKISPRTNCGTVTLGDSGDSFVIPAGATITNNGTQTGFGRTGTVNWDTTAKTASFTAVSGNGYFVNTTSGAITVTLPASPSAGDIVAFADYARTFETNNLTIGRNGSNIQGTAADGTITTNGQSTMFVYVDATKGWIPTEDQTTANYGVAYVSATGGTITTCGDYKIHTFTSPGTFCVSCAGNPAGSDTVEYLVVAGGGSGSAKGPGDAGGGGGAGGFRFASPSLAPLTFPGKPLNGPVALPVTITGYPITVGAGGAGASAPGGPCAPNGNGANGSNSIFSTITSTGGGRGGYNNPRCGATGFPGGSGGGAGSGTPVGPTQPGGTGNTPPVSPPQGQPGGLFTYPGSGPNSLGAGGGGAICAGDSGSPTPGPGGAGAGLPNGFGTSGENCGSYYYFSGGGGGGIRSGTNASGGIGGGGNSCANGTANTGGGGGAGVGDGTPAAGGSGGSGIVVIRYKYQ